MSADYFRNRGDEYGKKLAAGMDAAAQDDFSFSAKTAITLGAKIENAERVMNAIANDYRGGLHGFESMVDGDSAEVYGYCHAIVTAELQEKETKARWFLNHPTA